MQHANGRDSEAQQQQQQNRYAHLVSGRGGGKTGTVVTSGNNFYQAKDKTTTTTTTTNVPLLTNSGKQNNNNNNNQNGQSMNTASNNKTKAPPLGMGASDAAGSPQQRAYANNYYTSFSNVDWREQWYIMKDRILEKVEEPQSQRKLILFIVCCALLLDNMLYMVIVPIIPDYLRSIGSWSTYTENAKWIRRNGTNHGGPKWERIGGQVVYEGEDSAVGFLFASKAIVQLFINPFSGAIIDRIGYEIPMMIGLTVMFFSTMVFACGQTYTILFLARSLQGVGSAFADTSGLAMIADRFTEENERQRALGVALAFISFGCLVAPPFGSVLYQAAGKEVPFIILSLVCLLDGSLLLLVTPPGTFVQLLPNYQPPPPPPPQVRDQQQLHGTSQRNQPIRQPPNSPSTMETGESIALSKQEQFGDPNQAAAGASSPSPEDDRKRALRRQKSISRRQSMTVASAGEAPKGTPIYVLFRDPCIACCAGALVVANVSLAFLEPTISIWVQNTMPDIEEWQMGMIWLPAFVPHVMGVYATVKLADKYPRYQWLIAAIGLVLEGLSCLMVPFCSSFWSLIIPISIICFGLALIDTAILPTLGFLVDTRYVSVYGSIYAIADISYSLSYAIGPVIAGGIVEAIGFTALNFLIAIVTLGYTPILMMLRNIHDYEPFEADSTGLRKQKAKELAPFGQFGRGPIAEEPESGLQSPTSPPPPPAQLTSGAGGGSTYESPRWASNSGAAGTPAGSVGDDTAGRKSTLVKKASIKSSSSTSGSKWSGGGSGGSSRDEPGKKLSVKIVEEPRGQVSDHGHGEPLEADQRNSQYHYTQQQPETGQGSGYNNPFLAD